jgi:hypothetical protein
MTTSEIIFGLQMSGNGLVWAAVQIGGFAFLSFSVDDLEWLLSGDFRSGARHDSPQRRQPEWHLVTQNAGGSWNSK